MTIQAVFGPLVTMRSNPLGSVGTGAANQNPQAGPSPLEMGVALLDVRQPFTYAGGAITSKTYGFLSTECQVINQVPSQLKDNNIAASQSVTTAVAMTLVSSTGSGITVATSITRADTGTTVTGLLAIDTAMAGLGFGQDATINMWDPTKGVSRNIRVTTNGDDTGGTYTIVGYDLYGYPLSEAITGVNNGVASGVKTFKYITSVTPGGTINSTLVKVGTGDVIGLPIRCDTVGSLRIFWNSAWVTASTGFTAAVTTIPATTTTGDVRGTYALQTASDGSLRLRMFITPDAANINSVTGLFGVTQNTATTNGA